MQTSAKDRGNELMQRPVVGLPGRSEDCQGEHSDYSQGENSRGGSQRGIRESERV